jgi:hypothetical protein
MKPTTSGTRIVVPRSRATLEIVSRAAYEMTASCYIWLERATDGVAVVLNPQRPLETADLEEEFAAHLDRISTQVRLEKTSRELRSALIARAFGPRPVRRPEPAGSSLPPLDPETEAEIEKLLAEIESDDWLDDAGDIAKTWEERFGKTDDDQGEGS